MPIRSGKVNIGGSAEGANNQVTLTNSSTEIRPKNPKRKRLLVKNHHASESCYIGFDTVSTANGYLLEAGKEVLIRSTKKVSGIRAGTVNVPIGYIEE